MLKRLFCLFVALITALPVWAADPVYEVEIIAFTRTVDPAMSGGEDASLSAHRPDLDSGFSLDMLGGLPIDNLKLGNVVARLKADQNYQVLLHQAWRQPVGPERQRLRWRHHPGDTSHKAAHKPGGSGAGGHCGAHGGQYTRACTYVYTVVH